MENIKSFISKKIISLQGEKIGYILNGLFDKQLKHFIGFVVVDEESEEEFILEEDKIFSCGEDCIVVESAEAIKPLILLTNFALLGKDVYTDDGVFLGVIKDIVFDHKEVKKILCDKAEILVRQVVGVGEGCVVVGKRKKQKKSLNFPKNESCNRVVKITQISSRQNENSTSQKPVKFMGNINSVIGKTLKENLFGLNNEIIAKKGEKINKKLINKALSHGKGNMLLFLSE